MQTTTHHTSHPSDAGTGGFVLWIAIYAAFMLALVAFNGGTHLFTLHQPDTLAQVIAR